MEAIFGSMIANGEQEELEKTYRRYKMILTLLTLTLFSAAGALVLPFVKLYTEGANDANYSQPVFAIILLMAEAIECLIWPCFNLSIAANKLKESRIGAYLEAVINLGVSFVLVLVFDPLIGVASGTLLSALFKSVYYISFSAKNVLRVKVKRLLTQFLATISILVVLSVAGMMIVIKLPLDNYLRWIACGFCTVAITTIISLVAATMLYPQMAWEYVLMLKNKILSMKR